MKTWQYAWIVFLGGGCLGVLSTVVKLGYSAGFSAAEVTGSQFLFGAALIWMVVLFTKKKKTEPIQALKISLSGIPMGMTGIFYYKSLQTLDVSLAIIFLFQFIWIGTLFEWMLYKKKPTRNKVVSITVLLVGSILAVGTITNGMAVITWQGAIWGMLAAFTFSTFLFFSGTVGKHTPPILKSALISIGSLFIAFLLFPPVFLFHGPAFAGIAPYGLLLGLFGVALPPLLFSIGMPHVGTGYGTILAASELPVAIILSALILKESVTIIQWFGVILILGGIIIGNLTFARHKISKKTETMIS
ncbi:Threonine/homoserine efflux transporter RhtA [Halobacillus dabanensis]|uniref:Threonine/homoserine efflux transporter RhtA n=1 Tax=Halobacillus dabanensis TaxID=240302 RepID=A0A1I3YPP5_HALDA|nr:DMT family transporter [Halobacillus dabanensis]SFK33329.1 Threonine/homoserine efflux transporter RhtA [Halobacillus dabanensis]